LTEREDLRIHRTSTSNTRSAEDDKASQDIRVWVGLVDLEPLEGRQSRGGLAVAFANALSVAVDARNFERRVSRHFAELGFRVEGYEDVEPLVERQRHFQVPDEILALGRAAAETGRVQFDTYFGYEEE
jgi:hypothetical protein